MRETEEFLEKWWNETLKPSLLQREWSKSVTILQEVIGSNQIKTMVDDLLPIRVASITGISDELCEALESKAIFTVRDLVGTNCNELMSMTGFSNSTIKLLTRKIRPIEPLWNLDPGCHCALIKLGVLTYNEIDDLGGAAWIRSRFTGALCGRICLAFQKRRSKLVNTPNS